MALLGQAALAMWWDMAPDMRREFEDWHTHEHFPERLAIPGFLRSSRWIDAQDGEAVFVLYELRDHAVLSSGDYLARLNAPTPWSSKLMPHHRNMVRSQNEVLESRGSAMGRYAMTLRFSPADRPEELGAALKARIAQAVSEPGISGAHLLRHRAPDIGQTREQAIRGGADGAADWTLVVIGYESGALDALGSGPLSDASLEDIGATGPATRGRYVLSASATPVDIG